MSNSKLSQTVLDCLAKIGVRTICICPGARNAPLVEELSRNSYFEKIFFFEERSASFFAIGRSRTTSAPVAVLTTSGTAVGELLPAVMEAYYSCVPLVLVTADRPRSYRGTGAPQAAEQMGIFGIYSEPTVDWAKEDLNHSLKLSFNPRRPCHLNVCFEEPLIEKANEEKLAEVHIKKVRHDFQNKEAASALTEFLQTRKSPFAIVGGLSQEDATDVAKFLTKTKIPYYAEGPSQLRGRGNGSEILNADKVLGRLQSVGYTVDSILRFGDIPTHRLWRDLDTVSPLSVLSFNSKPFSGMSEGQHFLCELKEVLSDESEILYFVDRSWETIDFDLLNQVSEKNQRQLFEKYPLSEQAQVHWFSKAVEADAKVYLGNSLPIREWDLCSDHRKNYYKIEATRGLNGIDGQTSNFLGSLKPGERAYAMLGDLSALYDLQAPWAVRQLKDSIFSIVIINNGGGQIFDRMFHKKEYLNEHGLNFSGWAQMFGLSYAKVQDIRTLKDFPQVVEIVPNSEQTKKFWEELN